MRVRIPGVALVLASCASAGPVDWSGSEVDPGGEAVQLTAVIDSAALHDALLELSGPRSGPTLIRVRFAASGTPERVDSPFLGFPENFTAGLVETVAAHLKPQQAGAELGMIMLVQGGPTPRVRLVERTEARSGALLQNEREIISLMRASGNAIVRDHPELRGLERTAVVIGVVTVDERLVEARIQESTGSLPLDQEALRIAEHVRVKPPRTGGDPIQAPFMLPLTFRF